MLRARAEAQHVAPARPLAKWDHDARTLDHGAGERVGHLVGEGLQRRSHAPFDDDLGVEAHASLSRCRGHNRPGRSAAPGTDEVHQPERQEEEAEEESRRAEVGDGVARAPGGRVVGDHRLGLATGRLCRAHETFSLRSLALSASSAAPRTCSAISSLGARLRSSRLPSRLRMVTSLSRGPMPTAGSDTSLATTRSRPLATSFSWAWARTSWVSAAKPTRTRRRP